MNRNLAAAETTERPRVGLGDAGYRSEANLLVRGRPDLPELLVSTTKDWKQRKAARERRCPRGRNPKDLGLRGQMERELRTKVADPSTKREGCWWSRCLAK